MTFQRSGAGADPLLTAPVGTAASDAIFTLNGTQYITINGIDLQESAANNTNAAASPWVLMEAGYALLQQLSLIHIFLPVTRMAAGLPGLAGAGAGTGFTGW